MPRNIELKARIASLEVARETAQRLATRHLGIFRQVDTYFHAPQRRLKLRQIELQHAELIAYSRSDASEARASDYTIVPVSNPETLKRALAAALGIRAMVDKTREVFLYHNVRIHLDQVEGLGAFLEFEAVLDGEIDDSAGRTQVEWLCGQFGIAAGDVVAESYGDLMTE